MAMTDPFSRIAIQLPSETRFVHLALLETIKKRHRSQIHLYCSTPQDVKFYEQYRKSGLVDTITVSSVLYRAIARRDLDAETVLAEATHHEARLDVTYNRLAVTDRHLGRGYALGGFRHPRSRYSEDTSYLQMVHGYNELIAFWIHEIENKRPSLMINCGLVAGSLAKERDIPVRTMIGARYQNYYYWGCNEFLETSAVEDAYSAREEVPAAEIDDPYAAHMALRNMHLRNTTVRGLVRRVGVRLLRQLYWRLRGYDKAKAYYLTDQLAFYWRERRDGRRMTGPCTRKLADLEGETFAAAGRRPDNFYDQIGEFKNVVFINMRELGLEVVRKARAVATITGTGGFEATVMGKPVLSFGRHNLYNFMPHVRVVLDEARLKKELAWALSNDFDTELASRNGARFLRAVIESSFDMRGFDLVNQENYDGAAIDSAYRALLGSFEDHTAIRVA
jgi:hypothetical protein